MTDTHLRGFKPVVALLLCGIVVVSAQSVTECDANSQIVLQSVTIQPYPIEVPGTLRVSVTAELLAPLDNIKVEITVQKKVLFLWVNVESWTIDDVCGMLDQQYAESGCPVEAETLGLQCMCPFKPGTTEIKDFEFTITDEDLPGGVAGLLLSGSYKVDVNVFSNNVQVACSEIELEIA